MNQEEIDFEFITLEEKGAVAYLTINRPQQLNALNEGVLIELQEAIFEVIDPDAIRVIVLQSAGDKAFVAGADIKEMLEMGANQAQAFSRLGQGFTRALETLPQVVIGKVQGFALGGGMELAMACDILVASEKAKFGLPEVSLGLIPGFGGTQRLIQRVGLPVALDLLCCGKDRQLTGQEAFQLGLVSRVVAHENLDREVDKIISSLLQSGPTAIEEVKRLCREAYMMTLEAGLSSESAAFANCFSREESKMGMTAFVNKKPAGFDRL